MGHADGPCVIYPDESVDREKATCIVVRLVVALLSFFISSTTPPYPNVGISPLLQIDYPAACNTTRTLLVHQARLRRSGPTWRMRCSQSPTNNSRPIATLLETHVLPAPPEAYTTEHLSLTLAVRTVPSLAADIAHINEHGSHHELRLEDHAGFTPAMEIVRTCVGVKTSEVQITDIHQSKVYNPMINNDDTKANHSVP
jgi:glutamate-5-semialdehyde dehydrogenase